MTWLEWLGEDAYGQIAPEILSTKIGLEVSYQEDFAWDYPLTEAEDALAAIWNDRGTTARDISKKEWLEWWHEYRSYYHQYTPDYSKEFSAGNGWSDR